MAQTDLLELAVRVVGWAGVVLYVIAYYRVSAGRTSGTSRSYQYMNLLGAFGVAANAFYYGALPSAVVNVIWFGIAAATLLRILKDQAPAVDPARPDVLAQRGVSRSFGFLVGLFCVLTVGLVILRYWPRPPRPLQPVRVYTGEWRPYVGEDLPGYGPAGEFAREIFLSAGYTLVLEFTDNWELNLEATRKGSGAATFPYLCTPERDSLYHVSKPFLRFDYAVFYLKESGIDPAVFEGGVGPDVPEEGGCRGQADTDPTRRPRGVDPVLLAERGWTIGLAEGWALPPGMGSDSTMVRRYDTPGEAFAALASGSVELVGEGVLAGRWLANSPDLDIDAHSIAWVPLRNEGLRILAARTPAGEQLVRRLDLAIDSMTHEASLAQARINALVDPQRTRVRVVRVADAIDGTGARYRLLTGVEAVVLRWPPGFDDRQPSAADAAANLRSEVKVLDGPLRGRVLAVEVDALEVIGDAGR